MFCGQSVHLRLLSGGEKDSSARSGPDFIGIFTLKGSYQLGHIDFFRRLSTRISTNKPPNSTTDKARRSRRIIIVGINNPVATPWSISFKCIKIGLAILFITPSYIPCIFYPHQREENQEINTVYRSESLLCTRGRAQPQTARILAPGKRDFPPVLLSLQRKDRQIFPCCQMLLSAFGH